MPPPHHQAQPPALRGGKRMSVDDIEYVMHIMFMAVNSGHPYLEDYYFQAGVCALYDGGCGVWLRICCVCSRMMVVVFGGRGCRGWGWKRCGWGDRSCGVRGGTGEAQGEEAQGGPGFTHVYAGHGVTFGSSLFLLYLTPRTHQAC